MALSATDNRRAFTTKCVVILFVYVFQKPRGREVPVNFPPVCDKN
jgi:hypothetical protein